MGTNSTQARGVALFLIGFTVFAAGIGKGYSIVLIAAGVAILGVSVAVFQKCKPWEQEDN